MVEWLLAAVVAWCVLAVLVGLLIGRVVRLRDRQVPRSDRPAAGGQLPADPIPGRDQESRGR